MPNTNCLEGIECPECGQKDLFKIAAVVIVEVTDDGTEDQGGDYELHENSYCECPACGHRGKLADFTIKEPGQAHA